jgi:cell division protease FtsH
MIATMLGGRAAEDVVLNEFTVGAADDIEKATKLARKMVTQFGMSELGPISYNGKEGNSWLARELGEPASYSDEMASRIDAQVEKIIDDAFQKAKKILSDNRENLDKVAAKLLEIETIDGEEYRRIIGKTEPNPLETVKEPIDS